MSSSTLHRSVVALLLFLVLFQQHVLGRTIACEGRLSCSFGRCRCLVQLSERTNELPSFSRSRSSPCMAIDLETYSIMNC
ncbi:hypothetical protein AB6A40_003945 [Gnathostoma spinigerum]|uniref:Secreted protein n=1 Tax=Gnathostoma spinigerum TaxID=75299 RepID=A0ABD6EDF4_9BILA